MIRNVVSAIGLVGLISSPLQAAGENSVDSRKALEQGCTTAVQHASAEKQSLRADAFSQGVQRSTPATGGLIAAVDKRIDGCRILQMARQIDGFQPEPDFSDKGASFQDLK